MQFLARPGTFLTVGLLGPERVQPCDDRFGVVGSGQVVEIIPHQLVEAGSPRGGDPPGFGNDPLVDGECDVHEQRLGMHGSGSTSLRPGSDLKNLGNGALLLESDLTYHDTSGSRGSDEPGGKSMTAVKISSKVEETAWNELRDLARESKRSVSGLLSEAVEEYLARRRVRPDVLRHLEDSMRENEELGKLLAQ